MTTAETYSRGAIWFHWTIAALVVANLLIAFFNDYLPDAEAGLITGWHKAIGVTVLVLSVARIGWRLTHRPPPYPASLRPWERTLARINHTLFYLLIIALPLSGWIWASASETRRPLTWFGLFDIPYLPVVQSVAGGELGHEVHEILGKLMIGLVVLHVAAALKHHFADRNSVLGRMLPAARRG